MRPSGAKRANVLEPISLARAPGPGDTPRAPLPAHQLSCTHTPPPSGRDPSSVVPLRPREGARTCPRTHGKITGLE